MTPRDPASFVLTPQQERACRAIGASWLPDLRRQVLRIDARIRAIDIERASCFSSSRLALLDAEKERLAASRLVVVIAFNALAESARLSMALLAPVPRTIQ